MNNWREFYLSMEFFIVSYPIIRKKILIKTICFFFFSWYLLYTFKGINHLKRLNSGREEGMRFLEM